MELGTVRTDRLLGVGVELIDHDDVGLDAAAFARSFEVSEFDQTDGKDDDADGGEDEQRPVKRSQLGVSNGAHASSVEWICRRVDKEETQGGLILCRNAHGTTSVNASTNISRKAC